MSCGLYMAEPSSNATSVISTYCIRCLFSGNKTSTSNTVMLLFILIFTPGFLYLYTGPSLHTLGNYLDPKALLTKPMLYFMVIFKKDKAIADNKSAITTGQT